MMMIRYNQITAGIHSGLCQKSRSWRPLHASIKNLKKESKKSPYNYMNILFFMQDKFNLLQTGFKKNQTSSLYCFNVDPAVDD
jgi:hypothetical protein